MFRRTIAKMASSPALNKYVGATGSHCQFKKLLQEIPHLGRVWLAMSDLPHLHIIYLGKDRFILKDIPKSLPWDTIPDQRIFVYKYLSDDFLSLVKKDIPIQTRKQIIKASLLGIADLHDRQIVHLDIKPDYIMVDYHSQEAIVEKVQIIDFEDAVYLPKGRSIKGVLAGNDNWRSPEAHFKGKLKPTDMFSFGIVCIYAILGRVIFGPDDDFQKHQAQGALPALIRLQRQVSYFGDQEGINGLLKHIGDDEIDCQFLKMLWEDRFEENIPYKPFSEWSDVVDSRFKDLIQGLTNLDPAKRLTARQALEHP